MSVAGAGRSKASARPSTVTQPVEVVAAQQDSQAEPVLEVRSAGPLDAPGVCELVSRWANAGRLLPRTLREVESLIECFVVARLGEEVVGCAALIVCGEAMAEIRSVAVDPTRTGHGIGRRMVEFLLDESMRLDLDRVFLLTRNPAFFERCGFRTIDPDDLPDSFVHDFLNIQQRTFTDRYVMTREIGDVYHAG
ncbi:MAG: GNAT family N-acetyltransferase [Phycisphaerales bacterium]